MQKRIMLLGGNYTQMTCTLAAKAEGYYVISVDYLPDNPAHKYADEYHNVSTVDREAVLALAKELNIDGIVSYASDVSAPTAAYVSEALGLPTNPYESVWIMTHKDLFRKFMRENGFAMPEGKSFTDREEAFAFFQSLEKPVMVKPVDSSGSKGVNKVFDDKGFDAAWDEACSYSRSKQIIVERFIQRKGYQIDGDGFVKDGKFVFWGICNQHHDDPLAPHTPIGHSYPPVQEMKYQEKAKNEIERMLGLLGMRMGAYNIEYIVGEDDEVYILEVGPRNGGNYITDAVKAATGMDLAKYTVRQAVGDDIDGLYQAPPVRCASSYLIHSQEDGIFSGLRIEPEIEKRIVFRQMFLEPGAAVKRFRNASCDLGAIVLTFDNAQEMCRIVANMNDYIKVELKDGP